MTEYNGHCDQDSVLSSKELIENMNDNRFLRFKNTHHDQSGELRLDHLHASSAEESKRPAIILTQNSGA